MAVRDIGVPARDQPLDHGDHLRDMLGRTRLDIGRKAPQSRHILVKGLGGALCQVADAFLVRLGGGVDLVINIGDVAHIPHVIGAVAMAQQPVEHVEDDHRPCIANMREVVDRGPADIDADVLLVQRREG